MANTYMIDFTMTVGTTRCIVADSEEQALRIADALLRNSKFESNLYESVRESMEYDEFDDIQVIDSGDGLLPDYDDDELQEIYGIDMRALRKEN